MMQIYPILLVAIVLAADGGLGVAQADNPPALLRTSILAIAPAALITLVAALLLWWSERRLVRGRASESIRFADRVMTSCRWLLMLNHACAVLGLGWLASVRGVMGDLILLDEMIVLLPPVLGVLALWWLHYPIERRLRDALLLRRLDLGKPIYPVPARGQYVMQQFRMQLMLLLVPVLLILGISEAMHLGFVRFAPADLAAWVQDAATFLAGVSVFLFAPLLARLVLSVQPLPPGEVRDDLLDICRQHRVRVREILLWKTGGAMINAAVMGLIGRVRYVLLTDALIETLTREQVQAVMAHEIGHVRRHHMLWLVLSLLALLLLASYLALIPYLIAELAGWPWESAHVWIDGGSTIVIGLLGLIAFGWISRRYERQADTFAIQHLSRPPGSDDNESPSVVQGRAPESQQLPHSANTIVTADAVHAMNSALETIARLNMVDPERPSWRHGSIAWRQNYLTSIIGKPLHALPIDRFIRALKVAVLVVLVTGGGLAFWLDQRTELAEGRRSRNAENRNTESSNAENRNASMPNFRGGRIVGRANNGSTA